MTPFGIQLLIVGWFENFIQSQRDGSTSVYRSYFQLAISAEETLTRF